MIECIAFSVSFCKQEHKQPCSLNVNKTHHRKDLKIGHSWVFITGVKIPKGYGRLRSWIQCVFDECSAWKNPIAFFLFLLLETGNPNNHGFLEDFRLVLHGTAEVPHHIKAGPRVYDENYNTVQNERSVSLREKSFNRRVQTKSRLIFFSYDVQEKRQSLKLKSDVKMGLDQRRSDSEENFDQVDFVPKTDSHWLRLLSRLNGNWLQ